MSVKIARIFIYAARKFFFFIFFTKVACIFFEPNRNYFKDERNILGGAKFISQSEKILNPIFLVSSFPRFLFFVFFNLFFFFAIFVLVFVMTAWGKLRNVGNKIDMLADGNGYLAKALGLHIVKKKHTSFSIILKYSGKANTW